MPFEKNSNWSALSTDRQTARLVSQYCAIKGIKIKDYVRQVFQKELSDFRKQMEQMKEYKF